MNKTVLLVLGIGLIGYGLLRPNIDLVKPSPLNVINVVAPSDETIKTAASEVAELFKSKGGSKQEAVGLRDLYVGLSRLVKLDGEDQIIKNTEEIRQANAIAGLLLNLDIKGKYPGLAKESQEVIVAAIGDDMVQLTPDLRSRGSDAFMALAWAYDQILQ